MEKNEERKIYFDFLRIFATFSVIMLHVAAQNWYNTDINSIEWNIFNFYDSIVRWGVPIFIMISGSLLVNKDLSIKSIYKKYIFRIITSFICWSIIYTLLLSKPYSIKSTILTVIKGHYHMWFLFMIVGLYMITPLIKQITLNKDLTKYFIVLGIIFAIIIPQFISLLSINYVYLGNFVQEIMENINLHMILGYTVYYILGFYLDKTDIKAHYFKYICILGILGFIVTIVFSTILSKYTQNANSLFYGNFTLNVLLESILVFILSKKIFKKIKLSIKKQKKLSQISKYCFGIYLVHVLVITYLDKLLNLNTLTFNPIFSVPIISIIVFIISLFISFVINQIPILKKYIV